MKKFFKSLLFEDMGNIGEGWFLSIMNWVIVLMVVSLIVNIIVLLV